ncbi:MAG: hypothetical protein H7Y42_03230 [Chitinophagaceae bacterium]|nr:hypothetical protein [Chitinophagaceae bacterium]
MMRCIFKKAVFPRITLLTGMVLLGFLTVAQPPVRIYTVKDGRMFIMMDKQIKEPSLDSFINQYEIANLALKDFIRRGFKDSLVKFGWKIEENNDAGFMISKPLFGLDDLDNPVNKINFTQTDQSFAVRFPAVNNGITYGYNRFRNKSSFTVRDSVTTFFLRSNLEVRSVMLAGSFNEWDPNALAMRKTDSGWIADVKLGPGKYWYKFVLDGNWRIDQDNRLSENDGQGNINSVFYKPNTVFRLDGFINARKVVLSGSFNQWKHEELQMEKTATGWQLPLYLADGTYTYRFVVDGRWMEDPANPDKYKNEFDQFNSVIRKGKPYILKLDGYTNASKVVLSGSFNNWREDELYMNKTATGWELAYTLGPGNYDYNFLVDGKRLAIAQEPLIIGANHTFRLKGFSSAKAVYLAGDFNNWNTRNLAMKREGDDWVFSVHLSVGKHLYRFGVDGSWIKDPQNPLWEPNEARTQNSVIWADK